MAVTREELTVHVIKNDPKKSKASTAGPMNIIRAEEKEKCKKEMRINAIRDEVRKKRELKELSEQPGGQAKIKQQNKYVFDIK